MNRRRRIFEAFRRARQPKPEASEWMSLAEAARAVGAAERGSDLDRMSRGLSEGEESLLAFWARRVVQIGVPVYGRRIMSTMIEIIPETVVLAGRIRDEATRLDLGHGDPMQDFGALQVKRQEVEAALARVGNGEGSQV